MDHQRDGFDLSMSALFQVFFGAHASAAASYDLVEENVEGTGTPSGWIDSGSPNWDYTSVVLQGSQSLQCSSGQSTYKTFTGSTTVHAYSLFRIPSSIPGSTTTYHAIRDSAGTALATFRVNSSGQMIVFANGSESTPTVDALSANTTYHVWCLFTSGGTCSVAFSTDGTKPTSGNAYTFKTGGSGTAARLQLNPVAIYDRILASTTAIGNSP